MPTSGDIQKNERYPKTCPHTANLYCIMAWHKPGLCLFLLYTCQLQQVHKSEGQVENQEISVGI